jgi:hypothetical protein
MEHSTIMSVVAKRRKNIQAIEYPDKEKEVVRRARRRKSAEKKALENGDLHMNGTKMRRNEKMKSGEEVVVMKILKRGRG